MSQQLTPNQVQGLQEQILELQKKCEYWQKISQIDPLLKIYNRAAWLDYSSRIFLRRKEDRTPTCVLFIDIDDFGAYNKMYTHQFGDILLQNITKSIKSVLRADSIFGRYGGDEFVVTIPGGLESYTGCQRRILESTPHPLTIGSFVDIHSEGDFEQIIWAADSAMCTQKAAKKNKRGI